MFIRVFVISLLLWQTVSQDHDTDHRDKRILIQDNFYSIMSKLEALTKKVDALTAENGNLTQKMDGLTAQNNALVAQNQNLSVEVQRLKTNAVSSGHEVAFFAKLTQPVNGRNHFLHYDDVILNIGNAYNPNHGVFVAPFKGMYHFDLYVCSPMVHNYIILDFMVNQTTQGPLLCGDDNDNSCMARGFTVSLNAGDDVYVKTSNQIDNVMSGAVLYGLPTFSGFLIRTQ